MFKAINTITGEVRQFDYLRQFAEVRANGWTAGDAIDKAVDLMVRLLREDRLLTQSREEAKPQREFPAMAS
jgi:hypothetical protein